MAFFGTTDDLVDEAVFDGFVGTHDVVTVGILFDLLDRLAGVSGEDLVEDSAHAHDFFGLEIDVDGLAGNAAAGDEGLVNENAAVGQGIPFSLGAGAQKNGAHAGGLTDANRGHGAAHVLDRVIDGHAGRHGSAGAVNVHLDVLVGILRFQIKKLGNHQAGSCIVHLFAQEDDAVVEQAGENIIGTLTPIGLLHNIRD